MLNKRAFCLLIISPDFEALCLKNNPVPPAAGAFTYTLSPSSGLAGSDPCSVNVKLSLTITPPVPCDSKIKSVSDAVVDKILSWNLKSSNSTLFPKICPLLRLSI